MSSTNSMEETPPFKAEYAKSDRASCKGCFVGICKDDLRMAEMVQSPYFDGKVPNWYHPSCFFKKKTVRSTADVGGYDSLKWSDQETIQSKVMSEKGTSAGAKGKQIVAIDHDFIAEYAKSSRSECKGCGKKIGKNVLRLGHMEAPEDPGSRPALSRLPRWYHVECFMTNRDGLAATKLLANNIDGYSSLKKADQALLEKQLGKIMAPKRSRGEAGAPSAKRSKEEQTELDSLKCQNERIWQLIGILKDYLKKQEMVGLLEDNHQFVPIGEQNVLNSLSDSILFGALLPCPECHEDKLKYSTKGFYDCKGSLSEWSKCIYTSKEPKRKKFKLPDEVRDIPEIKSMKLNQSVGQRLFPKLTASAPTQSPVGSQEMMETGTSQPLNGFSVCIVGKLEKTKTELKEELLSLGAEVVDSVSQQTTILVSSQAEVSKKSAKIKTAEKYSIPVLPIGFLEEAKTGDALSKVLTSKLSDWGAVPQTLGKSAVLKSAGKSNKFLGKSVPKMTKMTLKGGGAVDSESGHEHDCHIYRVGDVIYSATLGMVDLIKGTNSYYKLQLLEHDAKNRYYIFRAWGRVGTSVGGSKLAKFYSTENAISEFTGLYFEKTGNVWGSSFSKIPGKFYPLEIDYGGDEDVPNLTHAGSKSKLDGAIQSIIRMIFDVQAMKQSLLEMEIDLNKMPLGKLSKNQIKEAYSALKELEALIDSGSDVTTHKGRFLELSNKFYTLIPHDFGLQSPPLLSNADIIKEKSEMLDCLLELEVSYSLLSGGKKEEEETDPIDMYYEKLKADLVVVDKKSDEFDLITEFISNTHGTTHSSYDLKLLELFKLERHGESKRYKPFNKLHNRQLLWHGSRTTNFGGIISQGLRIAPPEAPSTGYMFGKGLYFADIVSKSANYCRTTPSAPTGLMLLCEVALGNMYELTGSKFIHNLPAGYHSTKGVGRTAPDISGLRTTPEGVDIPMGVTTNSYTGSSSLLYNEFIVYDEAQVKMCYLLKVDFQYKSGFY